LCWDDPFCGGEEWPIFPPFYGDQSPSQPIPPPPPPGQTTVVIQNTTGVYTQGQSDSFPCTGLFPSWPGAGPCGMSLAPNPGTATSTIGSTIADALGPIVFVVQVLLNPSPAGGKAEVDFENANKVRWALQKNSVQLGNIKTPVTDELRHECEVYAHSRSDKNGNPRYGRQWVKDYERCIEHRGIENIPL
jgi:hypothetical protein